MILSNLRRIFFDLLIVKEKSMWSIKCKLSATFKMPNVITTLKIWIIATQYTLRHCICVIKLLSVILLLIYLTNLHRLYYYAYMSQVRVQIQLLTIAQSPFLIFVLILFSCYSTLQLLVLLSNKKKWFRLVKQLMRRKRHNTGCVWSWNVRSDEITSVRLLSFFLSPSNEMNSTE